MIFSFVPVVLAGFVLNVSFSLSYLPNWLAFFGLVLMVVGYPFYRTRKAIYEFLGEDPSFKKEMMEGVLKHGSVVAYWQARINERPGDG